MKYRKLKGYKYQLVEKEHKLLPWNFGGICINEKYFKIHDRQLAIWEGYAWDGASGPAIDTPSFMRASLVHDVLYQCMRRGRISRELRREADRLLRDICIMDGMSRFMANRVYNAVRLFGGRRSRNGVENYDKIYETKGE